LGRGAGKPRGEVTSAGEGQEGYALEQERGQEGLLRARDEHGRPEGVAQLRHGHGHGDQGALLVVLQRGGLLVVVVVRGRDGDLGGTPAVQLAGGQQGLDEGAVAAGHRLRQVLPLASAHWHDALERQRRRGPLECLGDSFGSGFGLGRWDMGRTVS
jgi:hypothetical protein